VSRTPDGLRRFVTQSTSRLHSRGAIAFVTAQRFGDFRLSSRPAVALSRRMKTIGLIGGMSWQSTIQYYRLLNELVGARLGGAHSAKLLLANVDFEEVKHLQHTGAWDEAGQLLLRYAKSVEAGGADILLIGANTMHKVAPIVEAGVRIPLLHVADVTGAAVKRGGGKCAALLGTRFTMEEPFYRDRLRERSGLSVLVPEKPDRDLIHDVIYRELCQGKFLPETRDQFRRIIRALVAQGADSVILGCTEIALLVSPADSPVPLYDTTAVHAEAAVDWALG
jgi:aspartate racemase